MTRPEAPDNTDEVVTRYVAAAPGCGLARLRMLVAITRGAIALGAAIVVAGCGGGGEREQVFTPADATRIADVRPVMPGWTWPQNPEQDVSSGSMTEAQSTDRLLVELRRQTADIVSLREAGNKWRDDNKLANLVANVLASPADAHELMAPFNAFSRGWGRRSGRITKDEEIDGLGDEAWLLRTETSGTEVTYHWRRGNLVLEAHVDCFGFCRGDIDSAARAWVDAIDEAAEAGRAEAPAASGGESAQDPYPNN